ncbi:MAG: cyclic nucleotide-binding domain-containing protein [Candidatus Dadabacteria bacterium]|nr:cyclic nucleotide-binding domain-containing protein [Candidatus Dadabacteria bacterium]NIQ13192.1 cyclic nucleotide-binding domain-containing protein [Candidatus Dadabacteria bacterium]
METLTLFQHATEFDTYSKGSIIFNEGDEGDTMYVIKDGEIEILVDDKVVETAGPGSIFGEMAIVEKSNRSATARAKTDCEVVPIDEKRFTFLVQNTPFFAIHVMRILAYRLRRMNEQLTN